MVRGLAIAWASSLAGFSSCQGADSAPTIFAAASLKPALDDATPPWPGRISYASSSTLARQIEAGAPVDTFVSAHADWVAHLNHLGLIHSPTPLASNELVVFGVTSPPSTSDLIGADCVAMGDPDHVPAGMYARQALSADGRWSNIAPRLVPTLDAPSAVAAVRSGACSLGVSYRTDITGDGLVIGEVLPTEHITYTAVALHGADPAALDWLVSAGVAEALGAHGFLVGVPTP